MSYLEQQFSLKGKTALVTGGCRGLGEMIARGLLLAGAKVYITSRKPEDCGQKEKELRELGHCVAIPSDLSSLDGIKRLTETLSAKEDNLDILINNSGKTWGAPLEEFPENGWDAVVSLNLKTPFYLTQRLLPLLKNKASADSPSHIVNIGSIAGISSQSLSAYPYGASKAAIHHLTKTLAKDLAAQNIHVNAIAPGSFPTKMVAGITKSAEAKQSLIDSIPVGRLGLPDDIAALIIYICSSTYLTGTVIPLDGGALLDI